MSTPVKPWKRVRIPVFLQDFAGIVSASGDYANMEERSGEQISGTDHQRFEKQYTMGILAEIGQNL